MSRKKPIQDHVDYMKSDASTVKGGPKIVAELPMNYFVLTHHSILDLQISVHEALTKGFKVTGGVSSYFDNPLGRRVWMQAVVKG